MRRLFIALIAVSLLGIGCAFWQDFVERAGEGAKKVAENPSATTAAKEGIDLLVWLLAGGWTIREVAGIAVKKARKK